MNISIVLAGLEDADEILVLQKAAYQSEAKLYEDWSIPPLTQTLPEIITEFETKTFLKAVLEKQIIGSVRGSLSFGVCMIEKLIVHPDYQRKGIGSLLMKSIEKTFFRAKRFELFTGAKSVGNIRFYQKMGYEKLHEKDLSPYVRLVFMGKNNRQNGLC